MTRINTNIQALRGLNNLTKSDNMLSTSLTRLSTGLQINSGKDNPSGLIASESLRLQITTIDQSIKNSNRANNVIATTDSALGEIGGLLNQIRGLVQEGLNTGALSGDEIKANQLQIDAALQAINRISGNTTFAGDKLIDGSKSFVTSVSTADAAKLSDYQVNEALFGKNSSIAITSSVTTAAQQGELRYSGGSMTAAATVEIAGSKGNQVLFLGAASTVTNVRDAVNAVSDVTGVEASLRAGAVIANSSGSNAVSAWQQIFVNDDSLLMEVNPPGLAGNATTINFVSGVGNNLATTAVQVGNAVTVTLGTDGSGNVDASKTTMAALESVINGISGGTITATSGTTGAVDSVTSDWGPLNFFFGADATSGGGTVKFGDLRPEGSAGTLSVVFADPGANNAALGVVVGAAASNGDQTITVNLATDGSGDITSTAADIAALIAGDSTASALISATATEAGVMAAAASTDLVEGDASVLVLKSSEYGSKEFVQLNVLSGTFGTTLSDRTTVTGRDSGTDIEAIINGQAAKGDGLRASVKTALLDASLDFAEASNVATTTATVTITGGGSLFQIGQQADASGQVGVGIEAINTARLGGVAGKLYELGTGGGKSLLDVGPNVSGSDLVDIVDQALNRVNTLRGRMGAIQKNVIDTNISTLGVALENISAARSQIIDTDFATETANMQKAQVLKQAGISVLAIANQVPQQVLALLR